MQGPQPAARGTFFQDFLQQLHRRTACRSLGLLGRTCLPQAKIRHLTVYGNPAAAAAAHTLKP